MTTNENGPEMLGTPRDHEDQQATGSRSVASSLPHATSEAKHGNAALFPTATSVSIARPVPMQTSGRMEFAVRCPECRAWHRHTSLGEKDAPCGAHYRLEFATKGAAA
ncbi:hypothetical protein [Streptomyces lavendulocolor]|uniref:hypothetical protein n=1 Tax=Streptomyces lavendulocolor TaxID=67316 RepID=UPI0033C543C6